MAYYNYRTNYPKKPKAADTYKNPEYGKIVVTVPPGKTDFTNKKPYKVINLYNIDRNSALQIVDRLKDASKDRKTANVWIDKEEPTLVHIKIYDEDIDAWLDGSDLNAVQSVLLKSGNYDQNEVMHLEDEIATRCQIKNREEINKVHDEANETSMDMWQRYLSKINDPETRALIELYSRVYGNKSYGHILSVKNAALIKSYNGAATFVCTPTQWRVFGRGVKRGAKPLPMYIWISNAKATQQDIEDAKKDAGWEDADSQDLSAQVSQDIRMRANKASGFCKRGVGYDVKDTYVLPGAKDKWATEVGLVNNLTGALNAAALADQQKQNVQPIEPDKIMEQRTEMAATWMKDFCENNGYNTNTQFQDPSNRLADYLISYCTVNATKKSNILREDNVATYAENATQVTLIITKLGLPALSRFNRKYDYTRKEATALMNVVFGIARQLEENSVINESIGSWLRDKATFVKMFIKALKQIGCRIINKNKAQEQPNNTPQTNNIEGVKQSFNEQYDRISKNYF